MDLAARAKPQKHWMRAIFLFIALAILPGIAFSQEETPPIHVTHVVTDDFPTVNVRVAAWDTNMVIIPNENLHVLEDGVPFEVDSVAPVDVGVRIAFVIDPGDGVNNTGITLTTVYEIASEYLETYMIGRPWMMADVDEVTVLVQEGDSTELVSAMSNDPALISQQLSSYVPPSVGRPSGAGEYTRTALRRGLDELQFAPGEQDKPQALVLFTPGMRADTSDIAERAIEAGIPIHVVMTRDRTSSFWEEALEPLATVTGGEFATHYGVDGLEPLFEDLTRRRQQLEVAYRTNSSAQGLRNVTVEVEGSGEIFTANGQYAVELSEPDVEVISPAPGAVINRQSIERDADPSDAEPTFLTVVAEVDFPEITWDIRSYQSIGQVPATLQVVLTDELGIQGQSTPRTVSVNYIEPPSGGTPDWLLFVTLAVALASLAAVVFLFLNRQHLAPALAGAGESISDFVERVTGRRTALVAKAYLVPLEGFEELPQRSFELYGTTAIGRSRKHADLLFHINDEDSAISRLHCTILDEDDHFAIRDEDSTNGTLVNGEKITPLDSMRLHDGDTVDVAPIERGGLRFLFQLADVAGEQPDPDDERRATQPRRLSDFEAAADEVGDTYDEYLE
jgi:pSer/pThr/pTyr-binding forkhead associated (FHA) protein